MAQRYPHVARRLLVALGVAAAVALVAAPGSRLRARLRRAGHEAARRVRYAGGKARGALYRQQGGHPELNVDDPLLADRVRSALGPLHKRLDVPHPNVMVEDHVVLLHGDVATEADRRAIERAAAEVAGVEGVESYLHVGLIAGDTRPSSGRAHHPRSEAMTRLLDAARHAGAGEQGAVTAVRGVLTALTDRLPVPEREQFLAHLPTDVRQLAGPSWRQGHGPRVQTVDEFVHTAAGVAGRDPAVARAIAEAVLGALRQLVPEEAGDVAAVLPAELRRFWNAAVPL